MKIKIKWENAISRMQRKGSAGIRRNKLPEKESVKNDEAELVNISRYEGHRYAFEIHQYT